MSQSLVSSRFPYVPLRLHAGSDSYEVEALLDTGFDGMIAVPVGLVRHPPRLRLVNRLTLADGTHVFVTEYAGIVDLGPLGSHVVTVDEIGDEMLVGRGLTDRFEVTLDHGSTLTLKQ